MRITLIQSVNRVKRIKHLPIVHLRHIRSLSLPKPSPEEALQILGPTFSPYFVYSCNLTVFSVLSPPLLLDHQQSPRQGRGNCIRIKFDNGFAFWHGFCHGMMANMNTNGRELPEAVTCIEKGFVSLCWFCFGEDYILIRRDKAKWRDKSSARMMRRRSRVSFRNYVYGD